MTPTQRQIQKHANSLARRAGYGTATTIIMGDADLVISGHSWYYTNRSGDIIRHPTAYSKFGWSSMVYNASECVVCVDGRQFSPASIH